MLCKNLTLKNFLLCKTYIPDTPVGFCALLFDVVVDLPTPAGETVDSLPQDSHLASVGCSVRWIEKKGVLYMVVMALNNERHRAAQRGKDQLVFTYR